MCPENPSKNKKVKEGFNVHQHLLARMQQRGVTKDEIQKALNEGKDAADCKPGTYGKVMRFRYNKEWEGKVFEEKEVTVYYKIKNKEITLLTVKARYGKEFGKEDRYENRI